MDEADQDIMRQAQRALSDKQPEKAENLLRVLLDKSADHAVIWNSLAIALWHQQKYDQADKVFYISVRLPTTEINHLINYAAYLMDRQHYQDGLNQLDRVLEGHPNHPQALRSKALCYRAQGDFKQYLHWMSLRYQALPELNSLLGLIRDHSQISETEKALALVADGLNRWPEEARLYNARAILEGHAGDFSAAYHTYKQALNLDPSNEDILINYMKLMYKIGNKKAILEGYHHIVSHYNIAQKDSWINIFMMAEFLIVKMSSQGWQKETLEACLSLQEIKNYQELCPNLAYLCGQIYIARGEYIFAYQQFAVTLDLDPTHRDARMAMVAVYMGIQNYDAALLNLYELLNDYPGDVQIISTLIHCFSMSRRLDEAAAWALRGLYGNYDNHALYSAFIMLFQSVCDYDSLKLLTDKSQSLIDMIAEIPPTSLIAALLPLLAQAHDKPTIMALVEGTQKAAEHYRQLAAPHKLPEFIFKPFPFTEDSTIKRPVRVGLLSSDLRAHSVSRFIRPLFDLYDPDQITFLCYSPYNGQMDHIEADIAGKVEKFIRVGEYSDQELIQEMRDDQLDIIIEMNGVTMYSRMASLVQRVAPVQIEWLGYPFSTGMTEMDYFLVDPEAQATDPDLQVEKMLPMQYSWICYSWLLDHQPVQEPPSIRAGYVTFGSLNNTYKYSRHTIWLWAQVLKRVENARFIVIRPETDSVLLRANLVKAFEAEGIDAGRIEFFDNHDNKINFQACYDCIDISLDTTPLTGGTTSVDCLDMGVPLVSLRGPAMHQRLSHAILTHAGVPELSVETEADYIDLAVALASDPERLCEYRQNLRQKLRESQLCDFQGFTADFTQTMRAVAEKHHCFDSSDSVS